MRLQIDWKLLCLKRDTQRAWMSTGISLHPLKEHMPVWQPPNLTCLFNLICLKSSCTSLDVCSFLKENALTLFSLKMKTKKKWQLHHNTIKKPVRCSYKIHPSVGWILEIQLTKCLYDAPVTLLIYQGNLLKSKTNKQTVKASSPELRSRAEPNLYLLTHIFKYNGYSFKLLEENIKTYVIFPCTQQIPK